jgi:hypothetical protein
LYYQKRKPGRFQYGSQILEWNKGGEKMARIFAKIYQHADYSGGLLQQGKLGPNTSIPNIAVAPYSFNDTISSVRIYRMT